MNAPYFKFFAGDYLNDRDVDDLPLEAQGILIRMWCLLWLDGSLPGDVEELARRCKIRLPAMQLHMQNLLQFFVQQHDGSLVSRRMESERQRSGIVSKARHNAAKKRWNKGPDAIADAKPAANGHAKTDANGHATAMHVRSQMSDVKGQKSENTSCGAPSKTNGAPPQAVLISLPLIDGSEFPITDATAGEWQYLFPALDVTQQLRSMRSWCLANSKNRKTRSGILRFVNGWLAKEQNRAPVQIAAAAASPATSLRPAPRRDEWPLPPGVKLDQQDTGAELWAAALGRIESRLNNPSSFARFRGTSALGIDIERNVLFVRVPCVESLVIRDRYGETLKEIFEEISPPRGIAVEFIPPREVAVA